MPGGIGSLPGAKAGGLSQAIGKSVLGSRLPGGLVQRPLYEGYNLEGKPCGESPAGCGKTEACGRAERGSASWKAGGCGESVRPSASWPQPCTPRKEKLRLSRGREEHPYGDRGDAVPCGSGLPRKAAFCSPGGERRRYCIFNIDLCVLMLKSNRMEI